MNPKARAEELAIYGWWPRDWEIIDRFLARNSLIQSTDVSLAGEDFRLAVRDDIEENWGSVGTYYNFFTAGKVRLECIAFCRPDGVVLGVNLDDASPEDLLRESQWLLEMGTSLLLVEPGRPPPLDFDEFVANARRGWEWIFEA